MFKMWSEGDLLMDVPVMEGADNVCNEQRLLEGKSTCDEAVKSVSGHGDAHRRE